MKNKDLKTEYNKNGYMLFKGFFNEQEIAPICDVITKFHLAWQADNQEFYTKRAVNSAYLTSKKYLNDEDRNILFQFISTHKLIDVVTQMPMIKVAFMNTQLFFNPVNLSQKNYWHRDPQYHLSLEEQQQALAGPEVLHFRIALTDEPGIELIPRTHKCWDSEEELNVRLEQVGKSNYNDISTGVVVPLNKGDLLVFSANMIHRGLYGKDRLSLDVLFCEAEESLVNFVDADCLPDKDVINNLQQPIAFNNTLAIKNSSET